jgi:hypothetical protein
MPRLDRVASLQWIPRAPVPAGGRAVTSFRFRPYCFCSMSECWWTFDAVRADGQTIGGRGEGTLCDVA